MYNKRIKLSLSTNHFEQKEYPLNLKFKSTSTENLNFLISKDKHKYQNGPPQSQVSISFGGRYTLPPHAYQIVLTRYFTFSFERELKNKLAEKTKGAQSEQQVLKKAFKYFDLNDNGTVEPEEFAKAIEKIGIQIPTKQVSCV